MEALMAENARRHHLIDVAAVPFHGHATLKPPIKETAHAAAVGIPMNRRFLDC
jgi:hypothetical protein